MRRRLPSQPWIQTRIDIYHRFRTSVAAQCSPAPSVADFVSGSIGEQPLHTAHRAIRKSTLSSMPSPSCESSRSAMLLQGEEHLCRPGPALAGPHVQRNGAVRARRCSRARSHLLLIRALVWLLGGLLARRHGHGVAPLSDGREIERISESHGLRMMSWPCGRWHSKG